MITRARASCTAQAIERIVERVPEPAELVIRQEKGRLLAVVVPHRKGILLAFSPARDVARTRLVATLRGMVAAPRGCGDVPTSVEILGGGLIAPEVILGAVKAKNRHEVDCHKSHQEKWGPVKLDIGANNPRVQVPTDRSTRIPASTGVPAAGVWLCTTPGAPGTPTTATSRPSFASFRRASGSV